MKGYWDNLRPFEKRVVVGVGALFFIVLNFIFVFPHFSDWSKVGDRRWEAERKLKTFREAIVKTNDYGPAILEFTKEGSEVAPEDQSYQFNNTINTQAGQSGVQLVSFGTVKTTTNQFFLEKSAGITVRAAEPQLVDFLYSLGAGESQIRVRGLSLRPDLPARQQLVAQVTLAASYQKKAPTKPAAPATPTQRGAAPPARATAPADKTPPPLPNQIPPTKRS